MQLKLYKVTAYSYEGKNHVELTVANNETDAEENVKTQYIGDREGFYSYDVEEVNTVDGYRIMIEM